MTDVVQTQNGERPWLPTPDTTPGRVLHRYDIPLVGTFEQGGTIFLYWCVTGHAAPENAWAYARIEADQADQLAATRPVAFDKLLADVVGDRACTFAIASDEQGITASVTLSTPATFDTVHQVGMSEMNERLQELFIQWHVLRERFPAMQSAASFSLAPSPS